MNTCYLNDQCQFPNDQDQKSVGIHPLGFYQHSIFYFMWLVYPTFYFFSRFIL